MFIGHYGVGFGAKKFAPLASLGFLILAAQFLDLLWPTLVLLHLEHFTIVPGIMKGNPLDFIDYPISHSLLMASLWGLVLGTIALSIYKRRQYAIVIFLCVISHWFLDLIVHRPDLPLYPGDSPLWGFSLWNHPLISNVLEVLLFVLGAIWYWKETEAKNIWGNISLGILLLLLVLVYIGNLLGPVPTSVSQVAWGAEMQWIVVILAFWVDHTRLTEGETEKGFTKA